MEMDRTNYLNQPLCEKCGGACCKRMPGAMLPEDVLHVSGKDSIFDGLCALFATGKYQVDWWIGDPTGEDREREKAYFVRPTALDDRRSHIYSPSWGGACVFLTSDGCALAPEDRPAECRLLEPKENGGCVGHSGGGKMVAAIAWIKFESDIKRAAFVSGREQC